MPALSLFLVCGAGATAMPRSRLEVDGKDPPYLFRDVTLEMLPPLWNSVGHTGDPMQLAFMGAAFVDLNGDGILDIVNPNHYSSCELTQNDRRCKAAFNWDVGFLSQPPSLLSMSPITPAPEDFLVVDDNTEPDRTAYVAEAEAGRSVESNHTMAKPWNADVHGFAVVDLDNDGHKDFYAGIGVNRGLDKSTSSRNILLWGQKDGSMRGGREAAWSAGLSGMFGRSRGLSLFDANNDGVLDVYLSHETRVDNLVVPSALLISQYRPQRSWDLARGNRIDGGHAGPVADYTGKAVLLDLDLNGHAGELVTLVLNCTDRGSITKTASTQLESIFALPESPDEYCEHRPPASSLSAMWFDGADGVAVRNFEYDELYGITDAARLAAADIDSDGLTDLAILSRGRIFAFFSRNVEQGGTLLDSRPKLVTILPKSFTPSDFSFADFDLDGVLDMYVAGEALGDGRLFKNRGYGVFDCCMDSVRDVEVRSAFPVMSFFTHEELMTRTARKKLMPDEETRGMSIADMNNDGYPDIFFAHARHAATVLMNRGAELAEGGRYVAVVLEGLVANIEGIGASVTLHTTTPLRSGTRKLTKILGVAQRSAGHDDRRLIFGLGTTAHVAKFVITWPSGYVQQVTEKHLADLGGDGTAGSPFRIKESAILAISGRWGGCGSGHDEGSDFIHLNMALATRTGLLNEHPQLHLTRKALSLAGGGGVEYSPVLIVQSDTRPVRFSVDVGAGNPPLGGILPPPARKAEPFHCSGGGTVFSHLRRGTAGYQMTPVSDVMMKPGWNSYTPYRAEHKVALKRPQSMAAHAETFFQLVDTLTCSLSPVFTAPAHRCQ